MTRRLTENHPLTKKLRKLERFMTDEGIELYWLGNRYIVRDTKTNVTASYVDTDLTHCTDVPSFCEAILIKEE